MSAVQDFEREFAARVKARYAIAVNSGTSTLHAALTALDVGPGDKVCVPPLTMSASTIAILQAGATPRWWDVYLHNWLAGDDFPQIGRDNLKAAMPVSLYGAHQSWGGPGVDDAAQTLRPHSGMTFTSYSTQKSKIVTTGEGGVLVTNSEEMARRVRWFVSLGYDLPAESSSINKTKIKSSDYVRHVPAWWTDRPIAPMNYRMNEVTAREGLSQLANADELLKTRQDSANLYFGAIGDTDWIETQTMYGHSHDYWCFPVALKTRALKRSLADAMVRHGAEVPFSAWRITYMEPAFSHLGKPRCCPNAESLQPRILQFQTNDLASAERNAKALKKAIQELESVSHKQEWRMFEGTATPCVSEDFH